MDVSGNGNGEVVATIRKAVIEAKIAFLRTL